MSFHFGYHDEYEKYLMEQMRADLTIHSYMMEMTIFFAWLGRVHPHIELHDIGYSTVTQFIEEELKVGRQVSTVNKKISALKSYFHFLWLKGVIGLDPCAKLKRRRDEKEEQAFYITDEELDFLFHTIEQDAASKNNEALYLRNMALITVFLWGGLRIQEASNLLWNEIVWQGGSAIVGISLGNLRRIVLNERDARYLRGHREMSGDTTFVFTSRQGERMSPRSMQFILNTLGKKAGLHIHAQKLRNTFVVHQLFSGYSKDEVADMLGIEQLILPEHIMEEVAAHR
ncbi:tyrosine-type recombinase/integrase [Aneurinibacillus aneurinilyticus]|jgi:site-specific recombinase XerD|uniref:Tyrosine-type recombinase/integrase n=2 Tax=Aneurinibacillus aneurinilyticus TaxID=1391 RepID=A0A848CT56_ANEAE|nr:tyrosine-type recombinase/integrase [Aneurinibacillus aneurinilyticus]ERI09844.1 phage integrase, SAM-like domain protein [Aneurinibacillus aneurinilyticus ATCC 12856]MCI1695497.1 tyrosine-type recombinase/integrase [Aneurinibacillus aneurinilyticus]MED0672872.1 tyrosine-type recombinase/integrase [Aneurinibacillus aneurinilyticus]MED0708001.1 tyrosine-type recombinase/integrase [Aneurinibacillus aneurinilyticus]MED0722164.1 tyrosine-type recombinase/integrase [Aneurinibacillus aneurinilyti